MFDETHRIAELRQRMYPANAHPRFTAIARLGGESPRNKDARRHLLHRLDVEALELTVVQIRDSR